MANKMLTRVQRDEMYVGYNDLTVMACPSCGVLYAIPERLRADAEKHGNFSHMWCCPNGHEVGYGENVEDKLKRQAQLAREDAARARAQRDQAQAEARAQKGRATRFRNDRDRDRRRVAHGVCPCCKRSFKQLARHMASQHPEFAEEAAAKS